ncbi:TonB-dependent receptor [Sphingopyxis sp. BSN-002]|uniref:TonB-dependent receptor plug domain-containing protein n=1 Tax=Sphingopyxis sp. BSN-002 TaxID=2911495 RepID=UPI001EDAB7F8|nr:TonB-dependent receptor [Sphingopyxis sp. BSN-002]UKK83119.1 TonB-dependent receptor [Sphingopyxis sp. BSN-002]
MSRTIRIGLLLLAGFGAAAAAAAQEGADTGGPVYDRSFFDRTQPSNAYEMVALLPGFTIVEGDTDVRGYSGAAGNVLIDGQRPSGKTDTLATILKRIPAARVGRIELIRAGTASYDMQGYALLANVILVKAGRISGRIEAEQALYRHGLHAPRISAQATLDRHDRVVDLFATAYREIDDEHGFGIRNRFAADGSPLRLVDYAQPEGARVVQATLAYRQPLLGGTLHINALVQDKRKFADIAYAVRFPAPDTIDGSERETARTYESGLRYERALGPANDLEVVGSYRSVATLGIDREASASGNSVSDERSDASEAILRASLRHRRGGLTIEAGAEGAINGLDSRNALVEDGEPVVLPHADVRVTERRAELFATASGALNPHVNAELGVRYEMSRLSQTGDVNLVKSLAFWKPRARLSWTPAADRTLRLLIEREVGQLDFGDFVGAASLTNGTVSAGNADLEPDSLWRLEATYERRFGAGSFTLAVRREWISNLVDQLPVVIDGTVFDAVGNIGSARRDIFEASLKWPLEGLGAKGVVVTADMMARRSRATDPTTGARRSISGDLPVEAKVAFTHDIPAWKLRWGGSYAFARTETGFKVEEVERDRLAGRLDLFAEYHPDARWTFRLFGKNLTDSAATRTRDIYTGVRGDSALRYRELRVLRSGRYVGLTVQRSFGG